MNQKFIITGMSCSACSVNVEKCVGKLEGVNTVSVNLLSNSMVVDYDESIQTTNTIRKTVEAAGYGASEWINHNMQEKPLQVVPTVDEAEKQVKKRIVISIAFLLPLLYVSMGHMAELPMPKSFTGAANAITYAFTQLLLVLPIVFVNRKYYQVGFKALFRRAPNMDSLIAVGSLAALLYGIFAIYRIGYGLGHNEADITMRYMHDLYFESAGTILTLITLGKYLEARSKGKTSEAISKLLDLAPKTAMVLREGREMQIPVEEVLIGDIIAVKPGESIPVDGIILEGSSLLDQSALTGESIPVEKGRGDQVIAATINKTGYFQFRAEKIGEDTTLAQIIRLMEEAGSSKAPISKLADRISSIFVPVVIGVALFSVIIWLLMGSSFEFALSIGIAVLVISCPCALGLATPVAIMVGTGRGAQSGILFKSAEALELLHSVKTVVLDKTGTITEGKPKVTDILPAGGVDSTELLKIAAAIEKLSEHPLAEAVTEKAREEGLVLPMAYDFKSISGKGVEAWIDQTKYYAGNLKFMQENEINVNRFLQNADTFAEEGKTPLYFAKGNEMLGIISAADTIKDSSSRAVSELKAMGISVIMMTGDNEKTANAIKRQLPLDKVVAEVLPQDKEAQIRIIQKNGSKVAMIGDGINDAPALARADVGIAIGAGTDIAIEAADVVLMNSSLQDAVEAIRLSHATIKNIKENLFWAFFYNALGIPLAAGVFYMQLGWKLNPMFGAAAMSLSSLFVVTNALRLRFFKINKI